MSDVLCIYYSRTGHTKKAMEEVAAALGAELLELSDGIDRDAHSGVRGIDAGIGHKECETGISNDVQNRHGRKAERDLPKCTAFHGTCSWPAFQLCFVTDTGGRDIPCGHITFRGLLEPTDRAD